MVENQRNTFYKMREMRLPTVGCPPWLDVATTASPWMLPTAGPSVAPWGGSIEIGIGENGTSSSRSYVFFFKNKIGASRCIISSYNLFAKDNKKLEVVFNKRDMHDTRR